MAGAEQKDAVILARRIEALEKRVEVLEAKAAHNAMPGEVPR